MLKKADTKVSCEMLPQHHIVYDDEEEEDVDTSVSSSNAKSVPPRKKMKAPQDVLLASNPPTPSSRNVWMSREKKKYILGACDMVCRDKVNDAIANFFYDNAIPFHAATGDSYKEMIEEIGKYGPGLVPPSMHELKVPLLNKQVDTIDKTQMLVHKQEWAIKGCSILSDGWCDSVVQKDIVNFLVNSPGGSVFIKSVEVSEVVKDPITLFQMLDNIVEEVGEPNVIQVVTDNASNYVMAGKKINSSFLYSLKKYDISFYIVITSFSSFC